MPWDALGLAPMDAEPQQGPQQAAVGIPQWQDLYEQYWSQQQATQVLQAAQQLLVIFPQQPFLAALVQRLQEELMAWGESSLGFAPPLCRRLLLLPCPQMQPVECW